MAHKIIKKAWKVRHSSFYWNQNEILYAVNANQARSFLEQINSDYKYEYTHATRCPEFDIIDIDGMVGTESDINAKIRHDKRIQAIKDLPNDDTLYVIKNGHVGNALLCWGHNGGGYSSIWENIGKYTKADLLKTLKKESESKM